MRRFQLTALLASTSLCAAGSLFLAPSGAFANPQGGTVVSGGASIVQSPATPNRLVINQTTESAVLNWQSFSIGAGQQVIFQQPNAAAIALNRVTGNQASEISGTLTANGQVWLVNPNGVFFGKGAVVNVAGIVATTSDITTANFMAGNYAFTMPGAPGATVANAGRITVRDAGLAAFVAPAVANSGVINARLGKVALASGGKFTVDLYGDNLVKFAVDGQTGSTLAGAAVSNSGKINADGGTVTLSVAAAENIVDNAINVGGTIEARTASMQNGKIVLSGAGGTVTVGGSLDASGTGKGETGGTVEVLGGAVDLASGASVDVSGSAGGGTALIGGNFHGAGPQPDAVSTTVSAGAVINADATVDGNGGNVAVWSNTTTHYDGTITAKGGAEGGNGGTVETSGKETLVVGDAASVTAGAPAGKSGLWLLDPTEIDIVSGSTDAQITPTPQGSGTLFTSSGSGSMLSIGTITTALSSGTDVVVETTTNDITVDPGASITAPANAASLGLVSAANINLDANIDFSASSGSVYLVAGTGGTGAITQSSGSVITMGTGAVSMTAATGIGAAGAAIVVDAANTGATATLAAAATSGGIFIAGGAGSLGVSSVAGATLAGVVFGTVSGLSAASGDISIGSAGSISVDQAINAGAQTGAITLATASGGAVTDNAAIGNAASGAVTVQADTITLGGAVTSGQSVTLEPATSGLAVDIGSQVTSGDLVLTAASLSNVSAPSLVVGNAGAGTLTVNTALDDEPMDSLQTATNLTLTSGGGIDLAGATVTTSGTQTYSGAVTLGANATLTGQDGGTIAFEGTLAGGNNALTIVDDAPPTFGATVSGVSAATLEPHTGANTIAVGDSSLHALASADTSYDFSGTLSPLLSGVAGTLTIGSTGASGTITMTRFSPAVNLALVNGAAAAIDITGTYNGTGSLVLTPGSGGLTVSAAVTASGGITATTSTVSLGANLDGGTGGVDLGGTSTDTLAASSVTVSATNAAIKLGSDVEGAGADTLTLAPGSTGTVSLKAVGDMTAVSALTVTSGSVTLGGSIAAGAGGVDLSATTTDTLATNVAISAANGPIALGSDVEGADTLSLTPGAGGTVSLQSLGATTALTALSITDGSVTLAGDIRTGTGGADFSGTTTDTLAAAVTISAGNGPITLGGDVEGAGTDTLTLTPGPTGTVSLQAVGVTTAVNALTVTNGTATLNGNVTTDDNGQAYDGAAILGTSVTLTDRGGGTIAFGSTLAGGGYAITIIDNVAPAFHGTVSGLGAATLAPFSGPNTIAVGDSSLETLAGAATSYDFASTGGLFALEGSAVSGPVTIGSSSSGGNITVTQFSPTLTLVLTNAGTGAITFAGAYDGAGSLALTSGSHGIAVDANVTASGGITATAQNLNLAASLSGGTGGVDLSGTTTDTLQADVAITATGAAINLGGNVVGSGADTLTLTPGSTGSVSLQAVGNMTAVGGLTVTNGAATLHGNIDTGAGGADFSGTTTDTLAANVTIASSNGAIQLGGDVEGAPGDALTLAPGATGSVSFQDVGNMVPVATLTVTSGAVTLGGTIAVGAGGADFSGTTTDTLAGDATISALDAAIKLGASVVGSGSDTLALTPGSTGTASLQAVGNTTAVAALSVTNGIAILGGNITAGTGGVDLSGTTTDNLAANVIIMASNAAIRLGSNVAGSGADTLTLAPGSTGSASLQTVGNTTPVAALSVTSGTATLGGDVSVGAGGLDLSGTTVDILAADVTITANNAAIRLGGVEGANADTLTLTPGSAGTVALGQVGNITPVAALTVTDGSVNFGGSIVTGAGGADLGGTTTDTLAANVTISAQDAAIQLGGNVLGAGTDTLTLTPGSTGSSSLQAIGNTTTVQALTITDGAVRLGGNISTAAGADLSGTTTDMLAANVTISAANAAIKLGGNVLGSSTDTLTLTPGSSGSVLLQTVGSGTAVDALTVTNGTTTLDGAVTTNGGGQTYGGPITLGSSVVLADGAGGTIAFQGTIDAAAAGADALTVGTSGGTITIAGSVGSATPLGTMTLTDAVLDLAANVGIATDGAAFSQSGATVLLGNGSNPTATTIATSNGDIGFSGAIDGTSPGNQALVLRAGSGTIALSGNLGVNTALGAVTLDDTDLTLAASATISTAGGAVSETGATLLLGGASPSTIDIDTTGNGSSGANISFSSSINGTGAGKQSLNLAAGSSGIITLSGNVGATTALGAVTLSSGGAIDIGGTLMTSGGDISVMSGNNISVTAPVDATLGGSITLTAAGSIDIANPIGASTTGPITLDADSAATGAVAAALTISASVGNASAGAISLTGAAITLSGTVDGSSTLTIAPSTASANIGLGGGMNATADQFDVAASGIADIGGNFTSISIATISGTITVDNGATPLSFQSPFVLAGAAIALDSNLTTSGNSITLQGPVTLGAGVTLDTTSGGATTGANIAISSAVNAAGAGVQGLTLDAGTAGTIALSGSIGSGTPLGAVMLTDKTLDLGLNVGITTSGASFSQNGATLLQGGASAGTTTIATSGGSLAIGAVDASSPGAQALSLNAGAGTITLSGGIGQGTALGAIALADTMLDIEGAVGGIKSNAAFSETGATVLAGAATAITVSNGPIGFSGAIDGTSSGSQALTLGAGSGSITLSGNVGSAVPLGAITLSGGAVAIDASLSGAAISVAGSLGIAFDFSGAGAAVTSTGGQIYSGVIALDAPVTSLTDSGGNAITFGNRVDGAAAGGQAFSVSTNGGTIALSNDVGSVTPLAAVTLSAGLVAIDASVSGGTIDVTGSTGIHFDFTGPGAAVSSTGGQVYSGAITLQAATTLTDSGGHAFTFGDAINGTTTGGQALSVSTGGTITLEGDVGSVTPLGAVTLAGQVVAIDAPVSAGAVGITGTSGIVFDDTAAGAAVTSTGGQVYVGAISLQAATSLVDTGGHAIVFENTIDGMSAGLQALDVDTGGTITLMGASGAATALGAVTLSGGMVAIDSPISGGAINIAGTSGVLFDDAGAGAAVTSTGGQTYSGAVTLGASTTLTDGNGGAITFRTAIDAAAAGAESFSVSTTGGTIAVSGAVGSGTALGAVTLSGGVVALDASLSGTTISVTGGSGIFFDKTGAGAAVTSSGGQTYSGAVALEAGTTLTDTGGNPITFDNAINGTVSGAQALTVDTAGGTIALSSDVGAATPLGAVTLSANVVAIDASVSGGAISVAGSNGILFGFSGGGAAVTSTGGQTYNGAITLEATTSLSDTSGHAFTFDDAINGTSAGGQGFSVSTGGSISLSGNAGGTTPLGAVTLSGGAVVLDGSISGGAVSIVDSGGIVLDFTGPGAAVTSTGGQVYDGAVTLAAATSLVDTGGNAITFDGTIDGTSAGGQALTISTAGGTIGFSGNVGATVPLGAVTLGDGELALAPNIVIATSDAPISQSGTTVLGGAGPSNVTIASSGGSITFGGTIDGVIPGDEALTLDAGAGMITLAASVGSTTPLGAVTLIDSVLDLAPGAGIATSDAPISETGATVLGGGSATVTTIASSDGTISFAGAVDGATSGQQALALAAGTGTIVLSGNLGSATPLGALTFEDGLLRISGSLAITTGGAAIAQSGATILAGGSSATSLTVASGGGSIAFGGTIDGDGAAPRSLNLAAGAGTITLSGSLGGATPLAAVSLSDSALDLGADVGIATAGGTVSQSGATVLEGGAASATTIATSGGTIAFGGAIDGSVPGGQALTVAAGAGTISLAASVGSATPLGAVTITDGHLALAANAGITTDDAPLSLTGAAVLGGATATATTFATSGGDITIAGSLDGTVPGAQALTLAAGTGTIDLAGTLGTHTALAGLTLIDGGLEIAGNTGIATAGGAFDQAGPFVLPGGSTVETVTIDTTDGGLIPAGANITFSSTIDDSGEGKQSLILAAGRGTVTLGGNVGATTPLAALTMSDAALELGAGVGITTNGGAVSQTGPTFLAGSTTIATNAGGGSADITFNGTIDGTSSGAQALTLAAGSGGTITLLGALGSVTPLGAVTLSDAVLVLGDNANITTAGGAVSETGATLVQAGTFNPAIDTTAGGAAAAGANVTLTGTIDAASPGGPGTAPALTIAAGTAGAISLGGAVGAATPLAALALTDAALEIAPNVAIATGSLFSQTGATLLEGGVGDTLATISASNVSGEIALAGTIDGTAPGRQALALSADHIELLGNIGSLTPLGAITLAGGYFAFAGNIAITTAGGAFKEIVSGGTAPFFANTLEANGASPTLMSIDTTAGGTVPDGADITLLGVAGSVSGLQAMSLNAGSGGTIALSAGFGAGGVAPGEVTPLGALSFVDRTLLLSDVDMDASGGSITETGATILASDTAPPVDMIASGGNVTFGGPIDGSGATRQDLVVQAGGTIALQGNVGATTALGSVSLTDAVLTLGPGVNVSITGGSFSELGSTLLLGAGGPTSTTITAANISFNLVDGSRSIDGGVTGEQSLTLDAAGGSIGFGGAVGAATPLGALSLIDSSLYLSSGVTTSGGIISEAGSTLLSGATSLDTTAGGAVPGGANVTFTGAIEGPESLSINAGTASTITLGSDIGAHTTLAALTALSLFDAVLSVPANFSITTAGGAVTETGATITAGGAAPTSFSVDTTNAGAVPAGANILFGSIGGGAPGTLTLALDAGTGGTITLLGDLGATAALSALSVTDAALQIGANVSVTTAGTPFVETGKTVLLGNSAGATLTTIDTTDHGARAGADITFGGSIDGGTSGKQSLTLDAGSAAVALGGSVGAATALGSVTLDDATLRLAAGIAIDTVGGAVMQSGATILLDLPLEPAVTNVTIATGGGNISFVGPIDGTDEGGQALTLIAGSGGTISLDDNVGASVPLGGLSLSAGTITVGGSLYQTMDGPITMNGTVSFIAPLVTIASVIPPSDGLPATTGANISLASVSGVATTLTLDPGIDAASIAGGDLLRIAILEGNGSSLTDLDAGTTSLGGEGIGTNITVGGFSGVFASQHAFIRPGGHWTINAGNVLITDPALAGLTNSVLSNEGVGTAIALMNQIQQLIARGDTGETAAQQAFLQSPDRPDYALDPFRQRYNILGVDQGNAGGFEDLSYVTDGFWEGLLKK